MIKKIANKIYFVQGQNAGRSPFCNSILINDELTCLFDSGLGFQALKTLTDEYFIDVVFNTHYHIDHIAGNRFLPTAKYYAHKFDAPGVESYKGLAELTGFDFVSEAFEAMGHKYMGRKVSREFSGDEKLSFGKVEVKLLHLPGHTPGHTGFYYEPEHLVFSADVGISKFGPWYSNKESSIEQYIDTIHKIIEINPKVLVTSHEGIIEEGIKEKMLVNLDKIDKKEELILKQLQRPQTLEQLVNEKVIMKSHPFPERVYRKFESFMLEKHLKRLKNAGQVSYQQGLYFLI